MYKKLINISIFSVLLTVLSIPRISIAQGPWLSSISFLNPDDGATIGGTYRIYVETDGTDVTSGPTFYLNADNIGGHDGYRLLDDHPPFQVYDGIEYYKDYDTSDITYSAGNTISVKVWQGTNEFSDEVENIVIDNRPPGINLQSPLDDSYVTTYQFDLDWSPDLSPPPGGTVGYYVEVRNAANNALIDEGYTGGTSQFDPDCQMAIEYKWRVAHYYYATQTKDDWTDYWYFTIDVTPPNQPTNLTVSGGHGDNLF